MRYCLEELEQDMKEGEFKFMVKNLMIEGEDSVCLDEWDAYAYGVTQDKPRTKSATSDYMHL